MYTCTVHSTHVLNGDVYTLQCAVYSVHDVVNGDVYGFCGHDGHGGRGAVMAVMAVMAVVAVVAVMAVVAVVAVVAVPCRPCDHGHGHDNSLAVIPRPGHQP